MGRSEDSDKSVRKSGRPTKNPGAEVQIEIPEILYRYRVWDDLKANPESDYRYNVRSLTHNEIYFARADDLNDPFEHSVLPDFSSPTPKQALDFGREQASRKNPDGEATEIDRKAHEWVDKRLWEDPEHLKEARRKSQKLMYTNMGMCSTSTSKGKILMWGHYANGHRGFCLGYDSSKLWNYFLEKSTGTDSVVTIHKAKYHDEKPRISGYDTRDGTAVDTSRKAKYKDWKYEEEYRVLLTSPSSALTSAARTYLLPDDVIVEVILGLRMPSDHRCQIIDVLRARSNRPRLYQARAVQDSYILEFDEETY